MPPMMSFTDEPARRGRPWTCHVGEAGHVCTTRRAPGGSRTARAESLCAMRRSVGVLLGERVVVQPSFAIRPGRSFPASRRTADQLHGAAWPSGVLMSITTLFLLRLKLRKNRCPGRAACGSCRPREARSDHFGA
jgi:hypothetical protein